MLHFFHADRNVLPTYDFGKELSINPNFFFNVRANVIICAEQLELEINMIRIQ